MNELISLKGWISDGSLSEKDMLADVSIYFKYIDIEKLKDLSQKERVKKIEKHFRKSLKDFLKDFSCIKHELTGSKKKPRGIRTQLNLQEIDKVKNLAVVERISIDAVSGAKKIKELPRERFFCVKMTVAIQIENERKGMQRYEERFVLIKAKSFDEAYEKVKQQNEGYREPYLNSDGKFVRWKIESLDDCYETDIISKEDLNDTEAFEVFSILKRRKLTKERRWDGRSQ